MAGGDSWVKATLQHGAQTLGVSGCWSGAGTSAGPSEPPSSPSPFPPRSAVSRADPTFLSAYVVLIALLTTLLIGVRQLLALRWNIRAIQRTWPPGLVVGVVSGAAGIPLGRPCPTCVYRHGPARIHLASVTVMAVLAALLLLEVAWLQVPLTKAAAVAALTMTASMLLPLRPMDGAALGKAGAFVGVATIAAALFVALGLL